MGTKVIEFETTKQMNEWLTATNAKVVSVTSRRRISKLVFWAPAGLVPFAVGSGLLNVYIAPGASVAIELAVKIAGGMLAGFGVIVFWGALIKTAWRFVANTSHTVVYEADVSATHTR